MRRLAALLFALALALTGACDDDDGDTAATGTAGGDGATTTAGDELSIVERYCETAANLEQAIQQELELGDESPSPEQVQAEFEQFAREHAEELDQLRQLAPQEISAEVDTLVDTLETVADEAGQPSGEPDFLEPFTSAEYEQAQEAVEAFESENCEGTAGTKAPIIG